ncbi:Kelch repeat-containing protein 2, partial [Trichinella papuae]
LEFFFLNLYISNMSTVMFKETAAVANLINEGFGDCPQVERFCYASDSRSLYVFGGIGFDENYKDQLYRFTIGAGWEELDQCGDFPLSRADACLGIYGNKLYLFGGTNANLVLLKDFIEYDLVSKAWRRIVPAGGYLPPPLSKASVCTVERCLYLFGGETEQTENANMGRGYSNKIYRYSIVERKWEEILPKSAIRPPAVCGCTIVAVGRKFCLIGGIARDDSINDQVYVFDTEKETWNLWGERVAGIGRAFHSAIAFAGHYILVYGGRDQEEWESSNFFIFDVEKRQWFESKCDEVRAFTAIAGERYGHAAAIFRDHHNCSSLVVCGGVRDRDFPTGVAQTILRDMNMLELTVILEFQIPYHPVCRESKQAESNPSDCAANNDCIDL